MVKWILWRAVWSGQRLAPGRLGVESVCCSERRAPAGARIALRNKASKLLERRKKNPLFRFNYCSFRVMQLGDIPRGERLTVGAPYKKQSLSRQPVGKAGRLGWWRANSRQAASSGLLCTLRSHPGRQWRPVPTHPGLRSRLVSTRPADCRSTYIRSAT